MSVVKRIIKNNLERVAVDELLADEYDQAGYGGIALTKTPLGTQINLYAMKPGRVIGKRGRAIKDASARLERELNIANPQITVIEVEVPELSPRIQAARIANALERGVHYRRSLFWSLNRTMESGALGCEIVIKGPLRSNRGRFEKVSEGYVPKSGDPALRYVKKATVHVKMKKGTIGVTVSIVAPDAVFPDKINLDYLPEIDYPEEEITLPAGVEPDTPEDITVPVEDTPVVETTVPIPQPDAPVTDSIVDPEALASEPVVDEVKESKVEKVTPEPGTPVVDEVKESKVAKVEKVTPEPGTPVVDEVKESKVEKVTPEPGTPVVDEVKVKQPDVEDILPDPDIVKAPKIEEIKPELEVSTLDEDNIKESVIVDMNPDLVKVEEPSILEPKTVEAEKPKTVEESDTKKPAEEDKEE